MKKNQRKIFLLFILILIVVRGVTYSQGENVWTFGHNTGLDFNNGSPVAIQTQINSDEACAMVCDGSGQLLFYTDGDTLYNKNGNIMPHGNGLTGIQPLYGNATNSTSQGAVIIPAPGNVNQYYVFSLTSFELIPEGYPGLLFYSVVDMSLDDGNGDVVTGKKGIFLDSNLTERMVGARGQDCNMWLVAESANTPDIQFKSFEIRAGGVQATPVISATGIAYPGFIFGKLIGKMQVSPNQAKLALCRIGIGIGDGSLELYDFNSSTGQITNQLLLEANPFASVCFSGNSTMLYAGAMRYELAIFQFNVSSNNLLSIQNSRTLMDSLPDFTEREDKTTDLKRAPDGSIYYSFSDVPWRLGVISHPDLTGLNAEPESNVVALSASKSQSFPSVVPVGSALVPPVITVNVFELSTTILYATYQWLFNGNILPGATNGSYTADQNGNYQVIVSNEQGCTDTSAMYTVTNATAIDSYYPAADHIHIYPNPVSDLLRIDASVPVDLRLYSVDGKLMQYLPGANRIHTGSLSGGFYLLKIYNHEGLLLKAEKIIKKN